MLKRSLDWIYSFLLKDEQQAISSQFEPMAPISERELLTNALTDIYYRHSDFFSQDDLVYFPEIQLFGAFKHSVVKDILNNKDVFGVSTVHLALNDVYFSADENVHSKNKKTALKRLHFLSKRNQFKENAFVETTFKLFVSNVEQPFNMVDRIVNPIIFLNVMNELDLLETFPEFNPSDDDFSVNHVVERVKSFFVDTDLLQNMLQNHLDAGNKLSQHMNELVFDMETEGDLSNARISQFLRSMIFAAVESTASFVTSFIYETHTKFVSKQPFQEISYQTLGKIADEVLRIHTPVPFIYRTVRKDAHVLGKQLSEGDMVVLFLAAANNDPSVFDLPYLFNLERTTKHLSFGRGHLACIGEFASFRIALNILNELYALEMNLELVGDDPEYVIHNSMYKIEELNVILHADRE